MDLRNQVNKTESTIGKRVNATISKIDFRAKGKGIVPAEEALSIGVTFKLADTSAVWNNFNLKKSGQPTWPLENLLNITGADNTEELMGKELSIVPAEHMYEGAKRVQATAFGVPVTT